jgi:hypothetical protein
VTKAEREALMIVIEVQRTLLKAQYPFMPLTTQGRAELRLEKAADLLKASKGDKP